MKDIKEQLEESYKINNNKLFIENDPISIPHRFECFYDIEISAFLTSIISFGRRDIIINKSNSLMELMNNEPHNYILYGDFNNLKGFKHRTIKDIDMIYYMKSLRYIYLNYSGLETFFTNDIKNSLIRFWKIFFSLEHEQRSEKHLSNVENNSAAKRLNMFLRWMVRDDNVDFGLWKNIDKSNLYIPLDVHVGNMSREFGLLTRNQNDWKSVIELTNNLKKMDSQDPIKYDLALFMLDKD